MITALIAVALTLPPVPGAYNRAVTPQTVKTTVCVRGYSSRIRPPLSYTSAVKRRLLHGRPARDYQLDHLISLSLGGAPRSLKNLWLQPIDQARRDDELEGDWHTMLCHGTVTLRQIRRVELKWKRARG